MTARRPRRHLPPGQRRRQPQPNNEDRALHPTITAIPGADDRYGLVWYEVDPDFDERDDPTLKSATLDLGNRDMPTLRLRGESIQKGFTLKPRGEKVQSVSLAAGERGIGAVWLKTDGPDRVEFAPIDHRGVPIWK